MGAGDEALKAQIVWGADRKPMTGNEKFCAFLFYGIFCAQIGLAAVGLANANVKYVGTDKSDSDCPDGWKYYGTFCKDNDAIAEQYKDQGCMRRLGENDPTFWSSLGSRGYVTAGVLAAFVAFVLIWLFSLKKCPRGVMWSSLGLGIVIIAACAFLGSEVQVFFLIVAAFFAAVFFVKRKAVNLAADLASQAVDCIIETPSIPIACLISLGLYGCYLALFLAGLLHVAQWEGYDKDCKYGLHPTAETVLNVMVVLNIPITFFIQNGVLFACAAGAGVWYLPQKEGAAGVASSPGLYGLKMAYTTGAGVNMFCAIIMAIVYEIKRRANSMKYACAGQCWVLFDPLTWTCWILWCCIAHLANMFTKFMVISHVILSGGIGDSASASFGLFKRRFGDTWTLDTALGMMMWVNVTIVSISAGMGAWIWMDTALEKGLMYDTSPSMPLVVFCIVLMYWLCSKALLALFLLVVIGGTVVGRIIELHGALCGIFIGCLCNLVFSFVTKMVHYTTDTLFFCWALEQDSPGNANPKSEMVKGLLDKGGVKLPGADAEQGGAVQAGQQPVPAK